MWKKIVPALAAVAALAVATERVRERRRRRPLGVRAAELAERSGKAVTRRTGSILRATRAPALARRLGV